MTVRPDETNAGGERHERLKQIFMFSFVFLDET
jgi:hypothetical protein